MSQITAKVIEHSAAPHGGELVTMQVRYPRFIHAEAKTHRVISKNSEEVVVQTADASLMDDPMLSRNASSSRAIPVAKMIEQVRNDPAMPIHWGKNQPGMQAREELQGELRDRAIAEWMRAAETAADHAETLMGLGAHKQVVNRILEPFQFISVIVTATEWANFFELRDHEDADPNIQALARSMKSAMHASVAVLRGTDARNSDNWHLPYITAEERSTWRNEPTMLARVSAARCARVSYLTHDGNAPEISKDLDLYAKLVGSRPLHASPVEHQGLPLTFRSRRSKNFVGWFQHRELVESETA